MKILFIIPGDINLPTGGYRYDRAIIHELQALGHEVNLVSLTGNYPFPSEVEKQAAIELIEALPTANDIAVIDGLAGGAHPELIRKLSKTLPVVALVHHPLCLENGLDEETARKLETSEAQGLEHVSSVITTSPETAKTVKGLFNVDAGKIHCVLPGVERGVLANPSSDENIHLLCVGSVIERKGHVFLVQALAGLLHLNWHLDCVGKTDFQPDYYANVKARVEQNNLASRITFHGTVDAIQLENHYKNAHMFVLPSLFEGYGMVYAEAIVRGLPVIGTTAGAIPDTVPQSCGMLVEPGNTDELATALDTMISNKEIRESYREACIASTNSFPTWEKSAAAFASVLGEVA
ncbi:MAG: glycosyltransferase family 4 protein [Pseudomonadota bacterium]